jgi:predicted  nucleic acid-binding Zn-ribbon protein
MSDNTFELIELMYTEFKENFSKIDSRLGSLENGMRKIEIKIENEVSEKTKALFDDREIIKSSLANINSKLDNITEKVEKHDKKLR